MNEAQETLIEGDEARVRILTLQGREEVPWHTHSAVTDNIFCLEGRIAVDLGAPHQNVILHPGDRCEIASRRPHRVMNPGSERARYLLVQGGGKYDFLASDEH